MKINSASIPAIAEHTTVRFIGDEAFVMQLESVKSFSLNETAARIWALIDGEASVESIVSSLTEEYEVPKVECLENVLKTMEELLEEELLVLPDTDE